MQRLTPLDDLRARAAAYLVALGRVHARLRHADGEWWAELAAEIVEAALRFPDKEDDR